MLNIAWDYTLASMTGSILYDLLCKIKSHVTFTLKVLKVSSKGLKNIISESLCDSLSLMYIDINISLSTKLYYIHENHL